MMRKVNGSTVSGKKKKKKKKKANYEKTCNLRTSKISAVN
jgi:hypothetical protein